MRGFILIAMIAVVSVSGRPEAPISSGYNYQPAAQAQQHHSAGHSQSGGYSSGAQNFGGNSGYSAGGSSAGGASFGGQQQQVSFSGGQQQGGFSGGQQQGGFSGGNAGAQQTIVQKHIYVHVPPPEEETQVAQQQAFAAAPRKHYKIIFIKAPSAPSISQQFAAAQAQNSEKTLIYVLVKKPEEINYEAPEQSSPLAPSKPEVYFIKYKTQKEQGVASSAGASSFTGASGGGFGSSGSGGDFSGSSGGSSGGSSFGSTGSGFASSGSDYAAPAPQSSYGVPHKK